MRRSRRRWLYALKRPAGQRPIPGYGCNLPMISGKPGVELTQSTSRRSRWQRRHRPEAIVRSRAAKTPSLPCDFPDSPVLIGRTVDLERIDVARHEQELWQAIGADPALWRRIPPGPFDDKAAFHD